MPSRNIPNLPLGWKHIHNKNVFPLHKCRWKNLNAIETRFHCISVQRNYVSIVIWRCEKNKVAKIWFYCTLYNEIIFLFFFLQNRNTIWLYTLPLQTQQLSLPQQHKQQTLTTCVVDLDKVEVVWCSSWWEVHTTVLKDNVGVYTIDNDDDGWCATEAWHTNLGLVGCRCIGVEGCALKSFFYMIFGKIGKY